MKIVHPTDFSECAEQARGLAIELAQALSAELILLHVAVEAPLFREGLISARELERVFEEQREWAKKALEERAAECRGKGIPTVSRIVTGVPHQEIVATAQREGAAFIVMGTQGRGGSRTRLPRERGRPDHSRRAVRRGDEARGACPDVKGGHRSESEGCPLHSEFPQKRAIQVTCSRDRLRLLTPAPSYGLTTLWVTNNAEGRTDGNLTPIDPTTARWLLCLIVCE